jgi:hypothetical protein
MPTEAGSAFSQESLEVGNSHVTFSAKTPEFGAINTAMIYVVLALGIQEIESPLKVTPLRQVDEAQLPSYTAGYTCAELDTATLTQPLGATYVNHLDGAVPFVPSQALYCAPGVLRLAVSNGVIVEPPRDGIAWAVEQPSLFVFSGVTEGAFVGVFDGCGVIFLMEGAFVGRFDGRGVGLMEGAFDGRVVGFVIGASVGGSVGGDVG